MTVWAIPATSARLIAVLTIFTSSLRLRFATCLSNSGLLMVSKCVDGVRDGTAGGPGHYWALRGEWLRLAPQAYGGGSGLLGHCSGLPQAVRECFSSAPRLGSFIRCSLLFNSGYILRQSTAACGRCSSWTKVCSLFVVPTPGCPDIPVVAQRQFPIVQLFIFMVQFSDKVVVVPVLVDRCPCSAVAATVGHPCFFGVADPHGPPISQLQLDKVVFVPVVQNCSSCCCRHLCRGAEVGSHGLACRRPRDSSSCRSWSMSLLWIAGSTGAHGPASAVAPLLVPHLAFRAVYTGTRPGL